MATYFVFGNAPTVTNLLDYTGNDERDGSPVKIENAEVNSGHYIMTINDHFVGAQIDRAGIVTAIYAINADNEGVRLLTLLIEQWSEDNSVDEEDIAVTIIDDEMGVYLEYV